MLNHKVTLLREKKYSLTAMSVKKQQKQQEQRPQCDRRDKLCFTAHYLPTPSLDVVVFNECEWISNIHD